MSIETHENRQAVVDLANSVNARNIIEIGVRRGRLSLLLAEVPTLEHLFLIDLWVQETVNTQNQKKNARSVKRWAKKRKNITVLHMSSVDAVYQFADNSIDFIFIDGDHSFEGVTADIRKYWPKVRPGGIISGDDYYLKNVKLAVDNFIPSVNVHANGRLWWAYRGEPK